MELGSCFESSCEAFLHMKRYLPDGFYDSLNEIRLVHGLVVGQGGIALGVQYSHGWVEATMNNGAELCFDTETGYFIVKATFYTVGKVTQVQRYTIKEVLNNLIKFEHYGPWVEKLIMCEKKGENPSFAHAEKGVHYE